MEKSYFLNTTALILVATVISFAAAHFYEIGYCEYFNIPSAFISIDISKYGPTLISSIAIFAFLSLILDSLLSYLVLFIRAKNTFLKFVIVVLWGGLTILFIWGYFGSIKAEELLLFGFVFVLGLTLIYNQNKKNESYDIINPKYSVNVFLSRRIGKYVGPILVISSLVCAFLYYLGYWDASHQKTFFSKPRQRNCAT